MAEIIKPMLLVNEKPMLVSSDASRSCLKCMKNGVIVTDSGANLFIQTVRDGVFPPMKIIYDKLIDEGNDRDDLAIRLLSINELNEDKNKKEFINALQLPSRSGLVSHHKELTDETPNQICKTSIIHLLPFTLSSEIISRSLSKHLTVPCFEKGILGLAELIRPLIRNKQVYMIASVSDTSPPTLKYISEGKICEDIDGNNFIKLIVDSFPVIIKFYKKILSEHEPENEASDMTDKWSINLKEIKSIIQPVNRTKFINNLFLPCCSPHDTIQCV